MSTRAHTLSAIGAAIGLTVGIILPPTIGGADTDRPTVQLFPACEVEDGSTNTTPCMWDAREQGNGRGESVLIIPTPECTTDADCAAKNPGAHVPTAANQGTVTQP